MACHKCRAIVLSKHDFGETSQIVGLFTRALGLVRGMAKGARRIKGDFEGGFDLLDTVDVVFLTRAQGLSTLTESRLVTRPARPRTSPRAFLAASAARELVLRGSAEHDPNPAVYDGLARLLAGFETLAESKTTLALLAFELIFLAAHGVGPVWSACITCGTPLAKRRRVRYDAREGGVLCPDCAVERPSMTTLSAGAAALAAKLAAESFDAVALLGAHRRLVAEVQEVIKLTLAYSSLVIPRSLKYVQN